MSDTSTSNIIIQRASGNVYRELPWLSVRVRKSLDEICHSLELELPISETGKIHKHDKIEVRATNKYITDSDGRRRVSTFLVDEVTTTSDESRQRITVIGRSPARDILDSSWSDVISGQQSLEKIAQQIASKFGLTVERMPVTAKESQPVYQFSWENESPWTKLLNEADNQGFIFTSNEAGNLYLWEVSGWVRDEGFFLQEGLNVRRPEITEVGAEQYREYVVQGNRYSATQIDSTCPGNRILTLNITDMFVSEESLRRRALTEMRRRREKKISCTVSGWGLSDAQIQALGNTYHREIFWGVNFLIPVKLPSADVSGTMLISQVELKADASGMTTDVILVNREVYL